MSQAQFQALPQAAMPIAQSSGTVSDVWYRFFQSLWLQISSGTPVDVTLQGVADQASRAQGTADTNTGSIQAETERATAAEASLQTQITNLSAQLVADVTNLQGQITNLQGQINTINQRLTNAGIP